MRPRTQGNSAHLVEIVHSRLVAVQKLQNLLKVPAYTADISTYSRGLVFSSNKRDVVQCASVAPESASFVQPWRDVQPPCIGAFRKRSIEQQKDSSAVRMARIPHNSPECRVSGDNMLLLAAVCAPSEARSTSPGALLRGESECSVSAPFLV